MRASDRYLWTVLLLALGLALVLLLGGTATDAREVASGQDVTAKTATVAVTVSGTVTGPEGPVEDCWIGIGSLQDWQTATTHASGSYSVSIQTDGELRFHVRPDVSSRLTQANLWRGGVDLSIPTPSAQHPCDQFRVRASVR